MGPPTRCGKRRRPDRAVAEGSQQTPASLAVGSLEPTLTEPSPSRIRLRTPGAIPTTVHGEHATAAAGLARRAARRPVIEQRLVPDPGSPAWHQPVGQRLSGNRAQRFTRDGTGEDAFHVDVHHAHVPFEGEGEHRPSRVRPDTRKSQEILELVGHGSVVLLDHEARRFVQAYRPAVVAEPGPAPNHVADRGRRATGRVREALQEGSVRRDDAGSLRLLEHELAHEDGPRIAGRSPG